MKRAQLNLVMAGLVVALAAGLYLSRETSPEKPPLLPLAAEAITTLEIRHPDAEAIVLRRDGASWQLTAPVQAPADPLEVASLTRLASLPVQRDVDAAVAREDVGLSPPAFEIQLNEHRLAFGGTEPLSAQRYLGLGERVVLVDNPPGSALDADYSDLVSKRLVPPGAVINRLELPGLSLSREEGQWRAAEAPEAGADQLIALVEGWREAQAMWNASALDIDPAANDTVRIGFEDGREITWIIARREPQFELVRPDLKVQHTLSRALVDSLLGLPPLEAETAAPSDEDG